jgi:phosphoglycerate dehydrogenase-like enzyme
VVNAARGPVVDEEALVQELRSGRVSVVLDVTSREPLSPDHPLWELPNVLLTPHVGAWTSEMPSEVYRLAAEQLRRFLDGRELLHHVTAVTS